MFVKHLNIQGEFSDCQNDIK